MEAITGPRVGETFEALAVSRDVRCAQHDVGVSEEVALERGDGSLDALQGRVVRDEDPPENKHGIAGVDVRQAVVA